ncbi:amino acid adenylation domain-containing protein [Nonomuraea purpurea]|uniref:Amino acid adenylation domain-containing protein n=1 Tax=Nonomuraea purpurea TaxID=1849276 RepID=A0ABV8GTI1_9ACTN
MGVPEIATEFPVNRKEQAMWTLHQLVRGRGICNIGFALRVDERLRWWPLQEALDHLVRRHAALRTVVRAEGTRLRKRILPADEVSVPLETLAATEEDCEEQVATVKAAPFEDTGELMIRAHLLLLPERSVICVVLHHLVSDATSIMVLMRELAELYDAYAAGDDPAAELAGQGALRIERDPEPEETAYWVEHLESIDAGRLAMAAARPMPARPTFAGDRLDRPLSEQAVAAVARLRQVTRTTDNIVLLAAYLLLLAKHGAGPDLVVGVPVSGRGSEERDLVGFHAKTLPIRVVVDMERDFAALARATRDAFLHGMEHRGASFESIQHDLDLRSADWRVPLFRHMFNFRPMSDSATVTIGGRPAEVISNHDGTSQLDLEIIAWHRPTALSLTAIYSMEVHTREEIADFLARFDALLVELDAGLDRPVGDAPALTADERRQAEAVNATARVWPGGVLQAIAKRARESPDAMAIGDWTYRDLLAAAASVRDELLSRGIGAGDTVALHAGRGRRLAAAVLGVWGAGAAYLPLDPAHPPERTAFELADAGVRVVLAGRDLPQPLAAGIEVLALDSLTDKGGDAGGGWRDGDVAYLIYTSGSTGRPKGVRVSHAGLANVVHHFAEAAEVTRGDRMLWSTTFSFDVSALELLVPLVAGGGVAVASDESRLAPDAFLDLVRREDVTVVQGTPTLWRHLAPHLGDRLRGVRVLCGGEALTVALAEQLLGAGCRLFNVYGPTETTIWSTAVELRLPLTDRMPIGSPISNTTVHVLDTGGFPVPPGVPGELCIGGTGVALGYHDDPGKTADRFRTHPERGRYYRTGDQVRQRGDGLLEFIGRSDRQVKVRGHRVEPAEVEAVIEEHDAVVDVAVIPETDPAGHVRLVAAVRLAQNGPGAAARDTAVDSVRAYAERKLPAATLPARFVVIDDLPLTGNGKIDYTAVATAVAGPDRSAAPRLPDDADLRTLVLAWRGVLGDERLTADSNFFVAGGHSLLAGKLAVEIGAVLGRDVDFTAVFEAPTPAAMLARLSAGEAAV